jgi:ubiquinone/menaquinone biosynthesis C-methylase UbiE
MTSTLGITGTASLEHTLVEVAGLRTGHRVLDVDCNDGAATLEAARRVGPRGLVLGVDSSALMVARARRRATEAGLANVGFVHAEARTHRFGPLRFDVVMSRSALSRFVDSDAAFGVLARALRAGGRLVFVSPADPAPAHAVARRAGFVEPVEQVVDGTSWLVTGPMSG